MKAFTTIVGSPKYDMSSFKTCAIISRITRIRLDDIFCFSSNCILQIGDTMSVGDTGVVMYYVRGKKVIYPFMVGTYPFVTVAGIE